VIFLNRIVAGYRIGKFATIFSLKYHHYLKFSVVISIKLVML